MISKKEIEVSIQKVEDEIKRLEEHRSELKSMLAEANKSEATRRLLDSICEVSESNSMCVQIDADTKTTPIMDEFYDSDKPFLIFKKAFYLSLSVGWKMSSLVVTKNNCDVNYAYTGLTMTDLKKAVGRSVGKDSLSYLKEKDRKYPLYRELVTVAEKLQGNETAEIMAFQTPCMIGGQTYSNQCGYGSEYCGASLVHQGTRYGETSKFLIIGVII